MNDRGQARSIDLLEKCSLLPDLWSPRVVAELNDYQVKVVRVKGEFVWHDHGDTDELFLVLEGSIRIEFEAGDAVRVSAGELCVVPRGAVHRPCAESEAKLLLIEPRGVVNTGSTDPGQLTAEQDRWI